MLKFYKKNLCLWRSSCIAYIVKYISFDSIWIAISQNTNKLKNKTLFYKYYIGATRGCTQNASSTATLLGNPGLLGKVVTSKVEL